MSHNRGIHVQEEPFLSDESYNDEDLTNSILDYQLSSKDRTDFDTPS
jgi:hypothetical protein